MSKKRKSTGNTIFRFDVWGSNIKQKKQLQVINSYNGQTLKKEIKNAFRYMSAVDPKNKGKYLKALRDVEKRKFTKNKNYENVLKIYEKYRDNIDNIFHSRTIKKSTSVQFKTQVLTKKGKVRKNLKQIRQKFDVVKKRRLSANLSFNRNKGTLQVLEADSWYKGVNSNGTFEDLSAYILNRLASVSSTSLGGLSLADEIFEYYEIYEDFTGYPLIRGKLSKYGMRMFDILKQRDIYTDNGKKMVANTDAYRKAFNAATRYYNYSAKPWRIIRKYKKD